MKFELINIDEWSRKEYYIHYLEKVTCTYSMTVNLDITKIGTHSLYPKMLWLLTDTVNDMPQFRTSKSPKGVGIFSDMNPSYTIFNKQNKNFSCIWTEFSKDYSEFLQRYRDDVEKYSSLTVFCPKPDRPTNVFDVSMLPWASFTSFNLNIYNSGDYLLPIFTIGKAFSENDKIMLPLAIQVHHAVCDGYHICAFIEALQEKINIF